MAHYPNLEDLKAFVQLAAPSAPVGWAWEPSVFEGFAGFDALGAPAVGASGAGAVRVDLSIPAFSAVGDDDNRRTFDTLTELQALTNVGLRNLTLSIKVTADTVAAAVVAERIRSLFQSPGGARLLRDMDLAVQTIAAARPLVANWGNGTNRAVVLEVFLSFAFSAEDLIGEAEEKGNWIETVTTMTYSGEPS